MIVVKSYTNKIRNYLLRQIDTVLFFFLNTDLFKDIFLFFYAAITWDYPIGLIFFFWAIAAAANRALFSSLLDYHRV